MLPSLAEAKPLPGPYEILELADKESIVLDVTGGELGRMPVTPRDGRAPKEVVALRVYLAPGSKATLPLAWDISAQHLAAGLWGYIESGAHKRFTFKVTKYGAGPSARFSLEAIPRAG